MARVSHTLSDPSSASDLSVETTAEHISEKALSIVDACGEGVQGVGYDRATKQATPYQTARIVDSTGCSPRSRLIPSLLLTVQKSLKVLERAYCVVCSFILFVGQVDKEDRRHRAEVTDNGVMAVSNGESQGPWSHHCSSHELLAATSGLLHLRHIGPFPQRRALPIIGSSGDLKLPSTPATVIRLAIENPRGPSHRRLYPATPPNAHITPHVFRPPPWRERLRISIASRTSMPWQNS